jgi:rRNA small subunit pseudouridine methyltransferase Nep1
MFTWMMLNLVLTESSLETIPEEIRREKAVTRRAKISGKRPREMLLDRSYHHRAMLRLEGAERRGRPDIVHLSLLAALGTPLNRTGSLRTFVHTAEDKTIYVNPEVRLPRNCQRFTGLIEQLYQLGRVPKAGPSLLRLKQPGSLQAIIEEIAPSYTMAFSRQGTPKPLPVAGKLLASSPVSAVLIGGFPTGHFSKMSMVHADEVVSIDPEMLDAWTVVARVIYEYEKSIGLTRTRLRAAGNPRTVREGG